MFAALGQDPPEEGQRPSLAGEDGRVPTPRRGGVTGTAGRGSSVESGGQNAPESSADQSQRQRPRGDAPEGQGGGRTRGEGLGGPPDPERRRRMMERLQSLPPEQREQFMQRMRERLGDQEH